MVSVWKLELMEKANILVVPIHLSLVDKGRLATRKLTTQILVMLNFRRCRTSIPCNPKSKKSGGSHDVPVRAKRKRATKFVTSDGYPDEANQYTGSAILLSSVLQSARQGHCAPVEAPVSPRGNIWAPVGAVRQLCWCLLVLFGNRTIKVVDRGNPINPAELVSGCRQQSELLSGQPEQSRIES